jgi:hypothetical protein
VDHQVGLILLPGQISPVGGDHLKLVSAGSQCTAQILGNPASAAADGWVFMTENQDAHRFLRMMNARLDRYITAL